MFSSLLSSQRVIKIILNFLLLLSLLESSKVLKEVNMVTFTLKKKKEVTVGSTGQISENYPYKSSPSQANNACGKVRILEYLEKQAELACCNL